MGYLLYCIFKEPKHNQPKALSGIGRKPVHLIKRHDLVACISPIAQEELTPNPSRLIAYEMVIEMLHRNHTVIPMRYGCVFEDEYQITRLMEERRKQYHALLEEIEGCVEMGIRVLWPDPGVRGSDVRFVNSHSPIPNPQSPIPHLPSFSSGRDYLTARRALYSQEEQSIQKVKEEAELCRAPFAGLFKQYRTETHVISIPPLISPDTRPESRAYLLSIYFLILTDSVSFFREAFQNISRENSTKYLLSGPWPPYNFVLSDTPTRMHDVLHSPSF